MPLTAPAALRSSHWLAELRFDFLKVGAALFGSGYVLVTYLHAELVDRRGWLTQRELLDAVAVGQVTPGPLLTTATFAGYVIGRRAAHIDAAGALGAVAATAPIFRPAFVFVAILGLWLPRLRERPAARGARDAANAAVAGLVASITLTLAAQTLRDPVSLLIAAACFAALLGQKLNATWVMLAAAGAGLARGMARGLTQAGLGGCLLRKRPCPQRPQPVESPPCQTPPPATRRTQHLPRFPPLACAPTAKRRSTPPHTPSASRWRWSARRCCWRRWSAPAAARKSPPAPSTPPR